MAVLNANLRAFDSYVKSLKSPYSCLIAHTGMCILLLPEQWKHCRKPT